MPPSIPQHPTTGKCLLGFGTCAAETQTASCAAPLDAPDSPSVCSSSDVVVGVGSATQVEADEDAAAAEQEQAEEDVDQGGGPEGKQVQRPVAVGLHGCRVLVVVGLVNRVDPHITSNKPAEEEERRQGVPGRADSTERVGGAVFGLIGAGKAGEQRQRQAKDSQHYQIDGDVVLLRAVMQIYCTNCNLSNGHGTKNQL